MSTSLPASPKNSRRLRRRLALHHLPLAVSMLASIAALYFTRPSPDVISRASFATAYPALALIAATLIVGPLNLLRRRPNPLSTDLRRDLGLWAGAMSIAHSVIGQCVHLRGRPWLYYVYDATGHHRFPVRHDLFGFANYTGAFGFLVLAMLFATSSDLALRRLGTRRWKQLQRWNYVVFALAAAHAAGYLAIEKQEMPFVLAISVCLLSVLAVQVAGILRYRAGLRTG